MGTSDNSTRRHVILAALLGTAILTGGLVLKVALGALRQPPAQMVVEEPRLRVEVVHAKPQDVPVIIHGYGEVTPRDEFTLTAKVAGDIVEVSPNLEAGGVVAKGELLFRIDARDYEATLRQAEARVGQIESTLKLIDKQIALDKDRLVTLARSREIAQEEFDRDKALLEEDEIGSQTTVNLTEMKYNEAKALYEQLDQAITLYPIKAEEARSGLQAARAAVDLARLQLERTEVRAPFDARVKQALVDEGQPVAPGTPAAVIANDAALEITVPIDSRDARRWLLFEDGQRSEGNGLTDVSWFGTLVPVTCRVTWSEDPGKHVWEGTLDRVEQFDQTTRTVHVIVVVNREAARAGKDGLPLVEGMFCEVAIPGLVLEQVVPVPRTAVGFEGELYLAKENRLERRIVQVARIQEEEALIASGVEAGELIVITRMADPLPGALISYPEPDGNSPDDAAEDGAPATEAGSGTES